MLESSKSTSTEGFDLLKRASFPNAGGTPQYCQNFKHKGSYNTDHDSHLDDELRWLEEKNAELIEATQAEIEVQLTRGQIAPEQLDKPKAESCHQLLKNDRLYHCRDIDRNTEDVNRYEPGGFHPILIGDTLGPRNRFRVVHKLGYGQFSTVWLCYDEEDKIWRAVKVICADSSSDK